MDIIKQDVISQVATNVIEDSIKASWNKVKSYFVDACAKDSIDYGDAYEEYLRNTYSKYSKIKTLIYRHVPQYLYSFYECIGVHYDGQTIDSSNINNLLEITNKIIITGTGGVGKSTLFKHLYLNTIEETSLVPVLIELRGFNTYDVKDICIKKAIFQNLTQNGFELSEEYFDYSMKKGGYVIFLDGFDEINRDRIKTTFDSIRALCDEYGNNHYIVSSRPSERFISWNDFVEMTTEKLTKEQALSLISKIDFDQKVKNNFYSELNNRLYDKYESFASNPLLLTIMLLTYNDHAVFPEKINDFYDQAFLTLFNMHDATKESYVRDIRSNLGCEDFKTIFSYICFKSYFAGEYQFNEVALREHIKRAKDKFPSIKFTIDDYQDDLTQSVCMLVKEGLIYTFAHRSFQEYFAALYTCKLPDEVQKKLLSSWMRESTNCITDSYLEMLYNMQKDKVNALVLMAPIKDIFQTYNKLGFSVDFLNELFEGISLTKAINPKLKPTMSLRIKNDYWCHVLMMNCRLNSYVYKVSDSDDKSNVINDLLSYKQNETDCFVTFEEALKIVSESDLLKSLDWFHNQVKFAFDALNKHETVSIGNKKKVASILESL